MDENEVLTIRQVSEKLQIAVPTLYVMARKGEIPCTRIGGSIRFRQRDIDEWLDAHTAKETPGIEDRKVNN